MRYRYNFRRKINQTRAVTNYLKNVSETKVKALTDFNEATPGPIQVGSVAYVKNFTMGGPPSQWTNFSALQGVPAPGPGSDEFNGKSFYWKHSTLMMRITTNAVVDPIPLRFRVVVYQPRRVASQAGFTTNPSTGLFQDTDGNVVGASTSGIGGTDLLLLNINKRNFDVKHDFKFTLQPPGTQSAAGVDPKPQIQGVYPCDRIMKFYLPMNRKLFKDDNRPDLIGVGHHWSVSIFADTVTRDGVASNWEVSARGSTTFLDN
ncbi:hypothetical protein [Shewanella sp.]|uniref:hypothetical protein n=1 Tax=Shewanella sp. TaxID=50422 RepID=UPI004048A16E